MIIDLILDRKDGKTYNPKRFYDSVTAYGNNDIAESLDSGTDDDIKRSLARYIVENEYNLDIISYIQSVKWI